MASERRAAYDDTEPPDTDAETNGHLDIPGREPDFYALLGVPPTASDDEIHHAFRRLAKLWHPDRFTAASPALRERAERRMRAVIRARDVLSDPISRHEYNARRGDMRSGAHHPDLALHPNARPIHMPNTPPPFFGAGSVAHYERTSPNPNGAGQFFGVLFAILALGLAASAFNGRFGDGAGSFIAIAIVLGLLALAGILFTDDSALARAAKHFLEADPAPAHAYHNAAHSSSQTGTHSSRQHHAGNRRQHPARKSRYRPKARPPTGTHHSDPAPSSGPDHDTPAPTSDQERPGDSAFDQLVQQALAGVPDEFQPWLENVVVQVVREPSRRQLLELQIRPDCTLLGLYSGVALTHQARYRFSGYGAPPEIITIFQGPIERYAGHDPERVKEQVRRTVLHEIAHHFGMSHEEMPAWIR